MTIFHSTAEYYARFRPAYPPAMMFALARLLGWNETSRLLDLGSGPGCLGIPAASCAGHVACVDPDPDMLDQGRLLAGLTGATNITWLEGGSEELPALKLEQVDTVLMGASFHWMNREQTLEYLDSLVAPDGAIVVAGSGSPLGQASPPWWEQELADLRSRWLGPHRRAGSGTYDHPKKRHEEILQESAFAHIRHLQWTRKLSRSLDEIIGLQLSYSYCAPALFGDSFASFLAELRQTLIACRPEGGQFISDETIDVLVATRAHGPSPSQRHQTGGLRHHG